MWIIILSTILVSGPTPGTAYLRDLPEGADVFVKGDECVINVDGDTLRGDPDCPYTVAIMSKDGTVERLSGILPGFSDDDEDRPQADTPPAVPPQQPEPPPPPPSPEPDQERSSTRTPKAVTSKPADDGMGDFAPYSRIYLERDQGPFGFVGIGIGVGARFMKSIRIGISVLQSLGRAQTQLLDVDESIEEELDLVLLHIGYEHLTRDGLFFYGEFNLGSGQLVSDAVEDDRLRISPSTQSIIAYRPRLGLGWRNGPLDLGVSWQITYAEGRWFPNDEFGSEDGTGPPENSGVLSQGLQLELGFNL